MPGAGQAKATYVLTFRQEHAGGIRQGSSSVLRGVGKGDTWKRPERSPPYSNHCSRGTVTVECTSPTDG